MTSSPAALAAGHAAAHNTIPSPVTIVLAVAAVGWVLWSRMKGQPLQARRLLVLPVVLTVLGITDLTGSTAPARGEGTCAYTVDGISSTLPYQFVVSGTSSPPPQPGWPTRPNAPLRQLPGRDHDGQLHLS